ESHMDNLTVRVEASEKLYRDSEGAGAVGRKLAVMLQSRLGVGCRVEVVAPKQMPRSEGKAVRIVDSRRI
ncbi:MAG: phenylacetate--CoA ligase, partial [Dehalococcoidia bacterium]|nr:phenylacetate--CoA ligase [Dehalococcoidia bacterium]